MALSISGSSPSFTTYQGGVVTSGTAVASTSGTSIDFTSIPSWVKRITVMFNGVSTNGSSNLQIQLGSGSITTTGYVSFACYVSNGAVNATAVTTGFHLNDAAATATRYGTMVISNISSNNWVGNHSMMDYASSIALNGGGGVTLSGTLDRVRITTVNGTDTFDAGTINILYE